MRTGLRKILRRDAKWNFQRADLTEGTMKLQNGSRGWYQIYTFAVEKEPALEELFWCGKDEDALAMLLIDIGAYRESPLDGDALRRMREILRFFAEAGYDIVLRVVYDHEGKAVEREPFFFAQVVEHIGQIIPIIKEYAASIYVLQGMLIGNWGEMHTSRFLAPERLKALWKLLKEELGSDVFFAVRKPALWRLLHPEGCGSVELPYDSMGLFDDAILSSDTHMGTFGNMAKEDAGWDNLWCREEELQFEERLCLKVPNGGEAVCAENYTCESDMHKTLETLKRMHITYLNKHYDANILDVWKQTQWKENDAWKGHSVYDYIESHLGYRFWINDVLLTPSKAKQNCILVRITIRNTGFANFYEAAEVCLEEMEETTGLVTAYPIQCDVRDWNPGSTQTISCEICAQNASLYLSVIRSKDGKRVFFANQVHREGKYFLGKITNLHLR